MQRDKQISFTRQTDLSLCSLTHYAYLVYIYQIPVKLRWGALLLHNKQEAMHYVEEKELWLTITHALIIKLWDVWEDILFLFSYFIVCK